MGLGHRIVRREIMAWRVGGWQFGIASWFTDNLKTGQISGDADRSSNSKLVGNVPRV